ncbi:hypothetical protein [Phaffia rhodozyma]|uniref:Uncharacterized protein n=1 Tax=Phaffia rhodozyma TaxID=264483 RepID=A0A0F7SWG7_PHARH|nr:hypothetical protein [Phaffia rhodozyma]
MVTTDAPANTHRELKYIQDFFRFEEISSPALYRFEILIPTHPPYNRNCLDHSLTFLYLYFFSPINCSFCISFCFFCCHTGRRGRLIIEQP